ncbi:MAG: hypothetical protein ACRED5_03730 [Propylenella sp.]
MGTYTRLFAAVAFSAGLAGTPAAFEMNSDAGAAPQETTAEWVKRGLPASYYVTRDFTVADLCIKDALDQRAADAARAGLSEIYLDAAGFGQLQAGCAGSRAVYAGVTEVKRDAAVEWVKRDFVIPYSFTAANLCIKDALDQRAADAARAGLTEIYLDAAGFGQLQAKCRAALGGGFPVYFVYADVIEVQRGDMPSLPLP